MKKEYSDKKLYYTMSEISEMFDLSQSQIRSWERQFEELRPHRNRKGNRLFTQKDIQTLKVIYNLVIVKGMRVQGAVREINLEGGELHRNAQVIDKLLEIKSTLLNIKESLKEE